MFSKKNIPNFITTLRFFGAVCILFLTPLKLPYFAVYTATGITDLLDGFLSRKLKATTAFGARLDSMADLFFYTISLLKLLPILLKILPSFIWIIVAIILLLRTISYIIAAMKFHRFAAHHTWLNKTTGLLVFLVPYFLPTKISAIFCFLVCVVGLLSTAEDLYIHIISDSYNENIKSAFIKQ